MNEVSNVDNKEKIINHLKNILGIIKKYFKCSLIDSLIVGALNMILMLILGMPHSILISIIVGITNIIPSIGPVIGAAIGGVILMFYDTKLALWFLVIAVVIQILDSLIIKPKLFGQSFGISGIWMFIALFIGGGVFGVAGMILVVPVIAIVQYLYKNVYIPYRNSKNA